VDPPTTKHGNSTWKSRALYPLGMMVPLGVFLSTAVSARTQAVHNSIVVDGLEAKSEILIDHWGVPHIYATTLHDAFFAQGWNAARDRLWQIDLWRRSGLGELAAVFGPSYVAQDRAIRLSIYRGDMDKEWAAYGPDAKGNTQAFVAGINAYVSMAKKNRDWMPVEFKLKNYGPAFWKADDIVRIRNHGLAIGGIDSQVMRAQLVCKTGTVAAAMELPSKVSPPWTPVVPQGLDLCSIPPAVLAQYELAKRPVVFSKNEGALSRTSPAPNRSDLELGSDLALGSDLESGRSQRGSNNWVVAPDRTTTGRPILANDPHREYAVPGLRYIAHVVAPGLNIVGAGEPALPGILVGHNEHIAFGLTVFPIAQEDLYVYDTNPENPNEYRYQDKWEPMQVLREAIIVRDSPDEQVELKFTRHGPVIMEDPANHRAYALRAAWLDTGGTPYFGAMRYQQAGNQEQFVEALKYWGEPGQNQVYADTTGKIGWFPAGFVPIRPNSDGLLPLPGDGRYEWGGYLDRSLLPSEIDPARGYIASANQMNLPEGYPYAQRRISFTWIDDTRFHRISDVLDGLKKVSIVDSERLQNDDVSVPGHRLIRVLSAISTSDSQLRDTIRWLNDWDFKVAVTSPQAALFEVWVSRHLGPAVVTQTAPLAPDSLRSSVSGSGAYIVSLMEHPDERLGPNPKKVRDDIMLATLSAAVEETKRLLGPDHSSWQWGRLSTILFEHPLSPQANGAQRKKLNVGPAPKAGDDNVVGLAAYRREDFRDQIGASFRMVLDVGQWDNSVAVNTPGQSGDPSSPHYRDLFPLWLSGQYFPLLYSRSAIEQAAERKIVLVPR
jgi:penicillin G amidase